MAEQEFSMKPVVQACEAALVTVGGSGDGEDMRVSTPGGVFHVRWDSRGGATAMGQSHLLPSSSTPRCVFQPIVDGVSV